MILAAAFDSSIYRIFFLLHIVSIVAAFAPMIIHPLVTAKLKNRGDGSLRAFLVESVPLARQVYGMALVAAGLFGILLVLISDDGLWEFSQTWVSIAFVLWIAMNGVLHGMILPGEKAWADGDDSAEQKVQTGGAIITLLFLLMMIDMIWKPGF